MGGCRQSLAGVSCLSCPWVQIAGVSGLLPVGSRIFTSGGRRASEVLPVLLRQEPSRLQEQDPWRRLPKGVGTGSRDVALGKPRLVPCASHCKCFLQLFLLLLLNITKQRRGDKCLFLPGGSLREAETCLLPEVGGCFLNCSMSAMHSC